MSQSLGAIDDDARTALDLARQSSEAARLGHIGTEHLLMGLLATKDSAAARALAQLGVTLPKVEEELIEQAMTTQRIILSDTMASSLAEAVFKSARRRADTTGRAEVTTTDLLVALVSEREGVAAKILAELGVGLDQLAEMLTGA
ncbi:MAG: ATP-dependent Clp protease ATP-binding subunit ClpC [Chloroflexota bacterium]|jgi:ATP-dependent Clp protease ATP-binding subunit ClpC|nr:ATP-dependent Clp protease ATP-binding subunit ClpC [Chloroflexota bacterium]